MKTQRFAPGVALDDLGEQSPHGERADAGLALLRWAPEDRHVRAWCSRGDAAAYAGSSTSTGPLAMTDPSWLVIVTSRVTSPAPSILS